MGQYSALLSLCHLDPQYIKEDVAHEEDAAAEKGIILNTSKIKILPPVEKSVESFGFKIVNWNIDGDHLSGHKYQAGHNQPEQSFVEFLNADLYNFFFEITHIL